MWIAPSTSLAIYNACHCNSNNTDCANAGRIESGHADSARTDHTNDTKNKVDSAQLTRALACLRRVKICITRKILSLI
jgi:hypothetical protein